MQSAKLGSLGGNRFSIYKPMKIHILDLIIGESISIRVLIFAVINEFMSLLCFTIGRFTV